MFGEESEISMPSFPVNLSIKYRDMLLPLLSVVRLGKKLRWKIFFQGGKLGSLISRKFPGRIHYCGCLIEYSEGYVCSYYIHEIVSLVDLFSF